MMFWMILEVGPLRSAMKILSKKKKKKYWLAGTYIILQRTLDMQHWHAKQSPGAQIHNHQDVKHCLPFHLLMRTYINIYCFFNSTTSSIILFSMAWTSLLCTPIWMDVSRRAHDAHVSEKNRANYGHMIYNLILYNIM